MAIALPNLAKRYRITDGGKFRLKDFDPADAWKIKSKEHAQELLQQALGVIDELQKKLYAQSTHALLLIFQGMDASGKDGAITHVMSGLNPLGCSAFSFKAPTSEELEHDFLWRCEKRLPSRGHIGIFNRSYYEEVLIVRVHRELLEKEKLPRELITEKIWKERFEDIAGFERRLDRNGIVVRKFFLNVSKREQKERFMARLDDPRKNWKFSLGDIAERKCWPQYMSAYQDAIQHTATRHAPWYVVPADHKWFARLVVAAAVLETLQSLKLEFPKLDETDRRELAVARAALRRMK